MPVKSFKMGPGDLEFDAANADPELSQVMSAQVRACTIRAAERVTTVAPVPVLSGDELEGAEDVDFTWTMVVTVVQDGTDNGLIDWSWTNRGREVPFVFLPTSVGNVKRVEAIAHVVPIDYGGNVEGTSRPEATFTWRVKADPVLVSVL